MTDYYPLVARRVRGLESNTAESRRALYVRFETALVGQLRTRDPPLPESEVTRERLSFHNAIRRIEAESMRGDVQPAPLRPPPLEEQMPVAANSTKRLIFVCFGLAIVLALALTAYWQRDDLTALFLHSPATQAQRETAPLGPKTSVGELRGSSAPAQAEPGNGSATMSVAVLYEEDPADAQGRKRYVGSVIWKTEAISSAPGQPPELAIRAQLEIPERRINMTMSLRRNAEKSMPASHMIEIKFTLPADFPVGGISAVQPIVMKQADPKGAAPLAGLAVKVTPAFFLVGLSAIGTDMQRNLQLLKEWPWFGVQVAYSNRRALLAIEKGAPGERAFQEAFTAWGRT
jgi:hypothetical protein